MKDDRGFTVGDLRAQLESYPDDTKILFEGGLTFSRLKNWSDREIVLQFHESEAELSPAFRAKHPTVVVAFWRSELNGERAQATHIPRL